MKNEALMMWLKGKNLCSSEGELSSTLIYAFESVGTYYAATMDEHDRITAYLDQMVTGTAGTLTVTPSDPAYPSVKLTIGEASSLLTDSPHDKVLTALAQRIATAFRQRRDHAVAQGQLIQSGIQREHECLLADLLPF